MVKISMIHEQTHKNLIKFIDMYWRNITEHPYMFMGRVLMFDDSKRYLKLLIEKRMMDEATL